MVERILVRGLNAEVSITAAQDAAEQAQEAAQNAAAGVAAATAADANAADSARAAAVVARSGAETARNEAEALVISDLGTTDGQTRALIEAPASQTAQALSATIAAKVDELLPVQPASALLRASVGASTVIAENGFNGVTTSYNGLGGLDVDADGLIVAVWRAGQDHDLTNAVIGLKTSADGGQTWSTANIIRAEAGVDLRDPSILITAAGTWVVTYFAYDIATANPIGVYALRSLDRGGSYTRVTIPEQWDDYSATAMRPIQLPSGKILAALYGKDLSTGYTSVKLVESIDDGVTWTAGALVANGVPDAKSYQEPTLTRLRDGRLLCLIRVDSLNIFRSYSSDDGATWTAPVLTIPNASARPAAWETVGKVLVCIYRRIDANARPVYRLSADSGLTWSDEEYLAVTAGTSQYADLVETAPNMLAVSLGAEGATAPESKVTFRYMTVAPQTTPIGDQGAPGAAISVAASLDGLLAFDTLQRPNRAALTGDYSDSGHEYVSYAGSMSIAQKHIAYVSGGEAKMAFLTTKPDGRFRCALKWDAPNSGLGLLVRLVNSQTFLLVNVEGNGGNVRLYKSVGGAFTTLVNAPDANLRDSLFHDIEVSFKIDRIKVFADGDKLIDHTLSGGDYSTFGAATRHGFYASHSSHRFGPWSLRA